MTQRLVFGDDQSQAADVAWLWINSHDWPGWQIEVLTATPGDGVQETEVRPWEPRHPRQLLRAAAHTPVHHERIFADPASALAALPDRDLLVIGPKGRGFRKTLHLGSTCDALLNNPATPLVIARHGVPTTRILVCADGSADCRTAIATLSTMPWIGQADVVVVTVPQPGLDVAHATDSAVRPLRTVARSVRTEVLEPDELQIAVNPRPMLLRAAARWESDVIVLGTRGLSGMAAVRAGSIATSLASHAPCSVLMARAN
jgi:nucleotide-binding universal stress UspA family protein